MRESLVALTSLQLHAAEAKTFDRIVVFDRKLSNKNHVDSLKTNCLKALDILKVVAHADFGADQKTLL